MFMNDVPLSPDAESIGKAFIPPEQRQEFACWKVLEYTHDYQHSRYYDNDDTHIKTWSGYDAFA